MFASAPDLGQRQSQDAVQEQALLDDEQTVLAALGEVENALSAYATGQQEMVRRQGIGRHLGGISQ